MAEAPGKNPIQPDDPSLEVASSMVTAPHRTQSADNSLVPVDESIETEKTVIAKRVVQPTIRTDLKNLEGAHFDHLHLQQYVGGGMSAVYRAVDESLSRTVAVKILLPELKNEEYLRRFKNEAKNSARLDHENIARVFYVGSFHDLEYIVFEYVDGDNLRQLVEKIGPMSLDLAIRYTLQITTAIQHAHERGVTHRDVKPSNAIITKGGRVKLVDMGLARYQTTDSEDVTSAGVTMGTFDYISPEQARDARSVDVRSDLYSLGCTLFFMLTGNPPYPDGTPIDKILQHSNNSRPDPRVFRSDLPREVSGIVKKLLAPIPDQRYQTPNALINDLLSLAASSDIPLYGFEQAMTAPKQLAKSLTERILPIFVPFVAIISLYLLLDLFSPSPELNQKSQRDAKTPIDDQSNAVSKVDNKTVQVQAGVENEGASSAAESCFVGTLLQAKSAGFGGESPVFAKLNDAIIASQTKHPSLRTIQIAGGSIQDVQAIGKLPANLTIRGEKNNLPTLRYSPGESGENTALFSLKEKFDSEESLSLQLEDLHLLLECPANELDNSNYALFSVGQSTVLKLNRCIVTIEADGIFEENFQQFDQLASAIFIPRQDATTGKQQPGIKLENSIFRGALTVLRCENYQPFLFSFLNGLVSTPGRLIESGVEISSNSETGPYIKLDHVTCMADAGLLRVETDERPLQTRTQIVSSRSIFGVVNLRASLIDHNGVSEGVSFYDLLSFKSDGNFFPWSRPFWKYGNFPSESLDVVNLDDHRWFEGQITEKFDSNSIEWINLEKAREGNYVNVVAADYKISDSSVANLIVGAGMILDEMPRFKSPSDAATASQDNE